MIIDQIEPLALRIGTLSLVLRNQVDVTSGHGIVVSGEAVVADNQVAAGQRMDGSNGIVLADEPPGQGGGHGHVVGNRIAGFGGAGITVQAPLSSVLVKLNTVRREARATLESLTWPLPSDR